MTFADTSALIALFNPMDTFHSKAKEWFVTNWRDYKNNHKDWKRLLKDLSEFLEDKLSLDREGIPPYDSNLLKLITIDFIS